MKRLRKAENVIEAPAPLTTQVPGPLTQSEPRVVNVRRIREQMSLLLRTTDELMKIKEINIGLSKDPDFALVMYSEDGKEICP